MHHSTMYHRKIVGRIYRIRKCPGAWSINCKEHAKRLFCDKYSCLMAVRKLRVFVMTDKKTSALYLGVFN